MGLSRRITGVSEVLTSNGVTVKVFAPIARSEVVLADSKSSDVIVNRIDLRRFGAGRAFGSKLVQWFLFSVLSSLRVVKDLIKKPCIVQYQSTYSALPAVVAKVLMNATVIGDDITLINPIIDVSIFKFTDVICTPSLNAYFLAKRLGKRAFYVPNGVESKVKNLPNQYTTKDFTRIIFVGALTFDQNLKAVENIIKLAKDLDKDSLEFNFSIVGGPLSSANKLLNDPMVLKGRVNFLGQVSYKRLAQLYASSSIGILPFFEDIPLYGGQRTKALEFFANNLLVMSGPEGIKGIDGLIPGVHYLLSMSLDEMKMTLSGYLSGSHKYNSVALAGLNYVTENFSWKKVTAEYINCIKRL